MLVFLMLFWDYPTALKNIFAKFWEIAAFSDVDEDVDDDGGEKMYFFSKV